jgi:hypothetical protein
MNLETILKTTPTAGNSIFSLTKGIKFQTRFKDIILLKCLITYSQEEYSRESLDLLIRSGFDFDQHKLRGIPHQLFGEYLISSGLCLNSHLRWITFNGSTDFAYLLKSLIGTELPND